MGIQMQTVNKYAAMDSSPGRADRQPEDIVGDLTDVPTIPSPEVGAEEPRHRMPVLRGYRPVQHALPCSRAPFFPSCTAPFTKRTDTRYYLLTITGTYIEDTASFWWYEPRRLPTSTSFTYVTTAVQ